MEQYPTRGQLERTLSQKIQAFYREQLGHQPSKVTCKIFDNQLAIILEESITAAENLLLKEGKSKLAEELHSNLDEVTKSQLINLIQQILQIEVIDMLRDATLETGRTGIIVILSETPVVRTPKSSYINVEKKENIDC